MKEDINVIDEKKQFEIQLHHMWLTLLGLLIIALQGYIASNSK